MAAEKREEANEGEGKEEIQDQRVEGMSVWRTVHQSQLLELASKDEIALENGKLVWNISPMKGRRVRRPIVTTSREVRRAFRQALDDKIFYARRELPNNAVPKPQSKPIRKLPEYGEVPCPLCRPLATRENPGEAWPDCECCGGDGVVGARQARAWLDAQDD